MANSRAVPALLVLVGSLVCSPVRADAQLGRLIKKAKEAVTEQKEAAEQKEAKTPPSAPGEALTESSMVSLLAGLRAADPMLVKRDRVQSDRDATSRDHDAAAARNEPIRSAFEGTSGKVEECRSGAFSELETQRSDRMEKEMAALQTDPVASARMQIAMMNYGKAMKDAEAKKDPVALAKAQQGLQRAMLGNDFQGLLRKDSLAVDSKCGKAVERPAVLIEQDRLLKKREALDTQIRELEAQAVNAGAQAAGMDRVRYAALKERVFTMRSGGARQFDAAEVAVVTAHQKELDAVQRALR